MPGRLAGGPQGQEQPGLCSFALSQQTNKQILSNLKCFESQECHRLRTAFRAAGALGPACRVTDLSGRAATFLQALFQRLQEHSSETQPWPQHFWSLTLWKKPFELEEEDENWLARCWSLGKNASKTKGVGTWLAGLCTHPRAAGIPAIAYCGWYIK